MCLMLVSAFAEVISLGAVLPFLGILAEPDRAAAIPILAKIGIAFGSDSAEKLVLTITVTFAALALLAGAIRVLLLWASTRIAFATGADLGVDVYQRTLYQPYSVHLARNSSAVISGIVSKVNVVVSGVMLPLLILASSALLVVTIIFALIAIDTLVALVTAVCFGFIYALITWIIRRRLHRNSQCIAYEQTQVIKALQEGLGGIRDVLLGGAQSAYCDVYRRADHSLRRAQGNNIFYGGSPRYIIEALGMMIIAALANILSHEYGGMVTALPVLGALALGAQRLLPALQLSYSSWASIVGGYASLADIIGLLEQPLPEELLHSDPAPLILQKAINFNDVRFRYNRDGPWVLDGLNLNIPKGARVGFIGKTGSGKSTILDLLMALLSPTEGSIMVDEHYISGNNIRAWQQTIAHVPQNIYLADATIAENIAFGVPRGSIDFERVRMAARKAQISDFIESRPQGYQAHVGERGIRLSGGQRQRIGIARALYKLANVIVFDEATSALDNETERTVIEAIECLDDEITILIVAHRLTTLKKCTQVIELEDGKIKRSGTYKDIVNAAA